MALLKSVNDVPGLDFYEYRDQVFYGKYDYRLRLTIPGVRYAYWCKTHEELEHRLKTKGYGAVRKADRDFVLKNMDTLKKVIDLQKERKSKQLGMRVEGSVMALFSNDLTDLQSIGLSIGAGFEQDYTQAQVGEYAGTKFFVDEPKHKFRVYLKSKRVQNDFPKELKDLFKRQPGLFPSPAMIRWLQQQNGWNWRWSSASHFIDYDDESTLSYLALLHGEMLGKKYKLEKRPDIV